ncbi:dynamin family protein [Bombella sp. TMW 2.2543]|uniref:Dynamin family protein n=1 Tax=Bombella pluederhausensis TaxID=2967336 RepID=A0ABT3WMU4_9PROT|nr:dynamin family protein [Bombella pluederhausensis]MCX5618116.1 dynamin family protein [Bombella pluederhausensis]
MIDVSLVYDPFSPENRSITVNGKTLEKSLPLADMSRRMLQSWIHKLPDELEKQFHGEKIINLTFSGTKSDQEDVETMVRDANRRGFKITVKRYVTMESPEEKFRAFTGWLNAQYEKPFFKKLLKEHPDKQAKINEALGDRFDIYVIATMSSGKSTLINAFLHKELMPAANEATTAVITEIKNEATPSYAGIAYEGVPGAKDSREIDRSGNVTLDMMQEWNRDERVQTITIEGPLPFVLGEQDLNVVLTDTPGPNNSRDDRHRVITMNKISDNKRKPLILYVLNAQQLGINDDKNLLETIGREIKEDPQARDRFLFVLNKADTFDPERENIDAVLGRCRSYLDDVGIKNPFIYPVSARLALLSRKSASNFTRADKGDLPRLEMAFLPEPSENWAGIDLSAKAPTTFSMSVDKKNELAYRSGMAALEAAIKGYARKYNYPFRLHRVASVAKEVLDIGRGEEQFQKLIAENEEQIQKIRKVCDQLRNESAKVWESQSFLDELRGVETLPREFVEQIQKKRTEREMFLAATGNRLPDGLVEPSKVESVLNKAKTEFEGYFEQYLAFLNTLMEESNEQIGKELESFYANKVKDMFKGLDDGTMSRPLWSALGDVAFNMDTELDSSEIVKEARQVSVSRWWNPFTWGDEKTVYDRKANVRAIWRKRQQSIELNFEDATRIAEDKIITYRKDYVELFKKRVKTLLPKKLDELSESIQRQEDNVKARAVAQAEAEERLEEIGEVKARLDEILSNKA